LLASYLRIAGVVALYRKIIIFTILVCVINQLIFTFIISMSCVPVSLSMIGRGLQGMSFQINTTQIAKQWDSSLEGHCINTLPFYFSLAGTSIGLDLVIIALPLPVLWRLQLRPKQKFLLFCLFALGFFVTVIQIIRIFTVKDLKTYTDSKNIVIWSCVEVSLGVSRLANPSSSLSVNFDRSLSLASQLMGLYSSRLHSPSNLTEVATQAVPILLTLFSLKQ
jgi:hypothetical protein